MNIEASDRYRRAKALACAALELASEARPAFLRAECADDEALHEEARWLLDALESNAPEDPPQLPLHAIRASSLGVEAPTARNYRLLGLLGEGGMGVVYLAERTDGDLGQRVALKLLNTSADADLQPTRRFASERRILAGLVHPNIAHLLDAGVSAEGRPFLAMEYVDGERIDIWCATHATSLKARIELFLKVCAAVEYAHRQLVIHRDIKPANILVTADGEPKLLDFGIARLLDDDASMTRTETGARALTLAYASPEQIEGAPLGTATDIYSLGVVLYQLVTGARPFDHLESAHVMSNAIVSGEITPPSRQTRRHAREPASAHSEPRAATDNAGSADPDAPAPRAPRPRMEWRVPGDVDAIILKALRREPAQRYASVAELAEDLRRFLASRPVLARRGHWTYRTRRFAWRWRWALAAGVTIVALLAGFGLDRQVQLERVAEQRDRAEALVAFMNDLFENADSLRSRGNEVTVREMLDRGARELVDRRDLAPAQRSALLFAMGRAYNALGLGDRALPLLQSARALLGPSEGNAVERAGVLAELAAAYSTRRDAAASIAADRDAIELLRHAPGAHEDEITRLRIRVLQNHVYLLDIPLADARAQLRAILAELKARDAPDTLLLQTYRALAAAYGDQSDGREAVEMARHALVIAERLYAPNDPRILPNRNALASAMRNVDMSRAATLYEALAADYERLIGPGIGLASLLNNQGILLSELGRLAQGIAVYRRAADIALAAGGREHRTYLVAISNLATLYSRDGQPDKAKALIEEVLPSFAAQAASSGMNRVNYAAALDTLAASTAQLGDPRTAIGIYAQADQQLADVDPGAYPEIRADILEGLATNQLQLGRQADARRTLDRLDALNRTLPPDHERRRRAAVLRERLDGVDNAPAQSGSPPATHQLIE